MEAEIAKSDVCERVKKVQERHEHFAEAKVAEGDMNIERGKDPRPEGAKEGTTQAQDASDEPLPEDKDEAMDGTERFNTGSPERG